MKRALVLGLGVAFGASAWAQSPVSVYPGTVVPAAPARAVTPATLLAPAEPPAAPLVPAPAAPPMAMPAMSGRADALQPLGGLLATPLPTSPTVPAGQCATGACAPDCGTPLFPTASRDAAGKSRPCVDRFVNWLTWHPGPSVLPVLTPTPYQAPLRAYFPCAPQHNPGYGSCAGGPAGCAAAGSVVGPGMNLGASAAGGCKDGVCDAPQHKGLGLFTRPSVGMPTTGSLGSTCAPVAIPLPAGCAGPRDCTAGQCATARPGCTSCGASPLDRLMSLFSRSPIGQDAAGGTTIAAYPNVPAAAAMPAAPVTQAAATAPTPAPVIMGYVAPAGPGYHFANPTSNRPAR